MFRIILFVKSLPSAYNSAKDRRLAKKLVKRLKSLDEDYWLHFWEKLNNWEFPIEFYDLIPAWWSVGMDVRRAIFVVSPVLWEIESRFGEKERLWYSNVQKGRMTEDEFEYWYSLDEDELEKYYIKKAKTKWWD